MALLVTNAVKFYDDLMEKADPRVEGYFMMSTPWASIILTLLYLYIVEYAGPKFMENRKPFDLRNVMLVYNFGMVALSGYLCLEFALSGWFAGYSLGCQPVDYSKSPQALRMVNACWLFFISKFIEFFDTIFFVLRKKTNQVSFLHVFHHGVMPVSWWFGVKFVPGGFGTFHALLNSYIHFMMYIYYGMSALGPHMQKYLWWKKYMTSMQITQFILVCLHAAQLVFIDCNYPRLFVYWIGAYALIFLIMFADFYIKAYSKTKKSTVTGKRTHKGSTANGVKQD